MKSEISPVTVDLVNATELPLDLDTDHTRRIGQPVLANHLKLQ